MMRTGYSLPTSIRHFPPLTPLSTTVHCFPFFFIRLVFIHTLCSRPVVSDNTRLQPDGWQQR